MRFSFFFLLTLVVYIHSETRQLVVKLVALIDHHRVTDM